MAEEFEGITREDFEKYRDIRYGQTNPERMDNPLWTAMVRHRLSGFSASQHFKAKADFMNRRPIWSFSRWGMSRTLLGDDSIVCIGGVHEDSYDPDFAIYNDVIVHHWDGEIEIFGYPKDVFEPTDYHTATYVNTDSYGESIYIIGGIGYAKERIYGTTPVYRLDLDSKMIERIEVPGIEPGWISKHEARYIPASQEIIILGGEIQTSDDHMTRNFEIWAFSVARNTWRKVERPAELHYAYEDPAVASQNLSLDEIALIEEYALMKNYTPDISREDLMIIMDDIWPITRPSRSAQFRATWSCLWPVLVLILVFAASLIVIWYWVTRFP